MTIILGVEEDLGEVEAHPKTQLEKSLLRKVDKNNKDNHRHLLTLTIRLASSATDMTLNSLKKP